MPKYNVLILADKKAKLISQLGLAENLKDEFNIFFLVAFEKKWDILNLSEANALQNKIKLSAGISRQKSYKNLPIKSFIKKNILMTIYYMVIIFLFYRALKRKLTPLKIDIFFVNGDRSGPSVESALLAFAKRNKIKVIIPYLSIIDSGKQVRIRNKNLYSLNLIDKFCFGKNSRYTFFDKGIEYSFYTLPQYMALKCMKVITENPFSLGNNAITDILCLDTHFTYNSLKIQSLFPAKIKIVGRPEYDFFLKNKSNNKKNLLFSLPQLYEHNLLDKGAHFLHIENIISNLSKKSRTIINLHPKSSREDYKYLESKYDCEISKNEIKKDIISAHTLVCVNSTVAIWGVLLGIKVIILNYFDLDCTMF